MFRAAAFFIFWRKEVNFPDFNTLFFLVYEARYIFVTAA
jgi:hypothetical protein